MIEFLAVPNARCSSTVGHYYLDLVEKNGGMYISYFRMLICAYFHPSLCSSDGGWRVRNWGTVCGTHCSTVNDQFELYSFINKIFDSQHCMPEMSFADAPPFVALKSTDNIPIESSWHLFTNYVGCDIKQIILLGKSLNYFNPGFQLHM
jgi:hypothetical protein